MMTKTRLLFVMGHMQVGGIEKSLINLCNALSPDEFDITVLLLAQGEGIASELPSHVEKEFIHRTRTQSFKEQYNSFWANHYQRILNSAYDSNNNRFLRHFSYYLLKIENYCFISYIKRLFRNRQFDTVIGFMQGEPSDVAMRCFHCNNKIVFYRHGEVLEFLNDSKYYKLADHIIVLSKQLKNDLSKKRKIEDKKITVLHNIVNPDAIVNLSNEPCDIESHGKFLIVTVARISPEKGIFCALESAKELKMNNISFIWAFVGGQHNKDYLRKCTEYIQSNDLSDYIVFTGTQNNPFPFVRAANLYVQPSLHEALGRTIVEAMVLGKAIVSTKTCGGVELIEDQLNGILCDTSPIDIANKIMDLYHKPDMIKRIGSFAKTESEKYCGNILEYKELFQNKNAVN